MFKSNWNESISLSAIHYSTVYVCMKNNLCVLHKAACFPYWHQLVSQLIPRRSLQRGSKKPAAAVFFLLARLLMPLVENKPTAPPAATAATAATMPMYSLSVSILLLLWTCYKQQCNAIASECYVVIENIFNGTMNGWHQLVHWSVNIFTARRIQIQCLIWIQLCGSVPI